ncbi:MAG: ABC transporter permease [Acidobacteriota bacterium]
MQTLWQDLRYAVRLRSKQPEFTLLAVMTLALGIGANTAIFSVVNGVLIKPLPYPQSQQLVRLFESVDRSGVASDRMEVAPANFLDWQSQAQSFSSMAAYGLTGTVLNANNEAKRLDGALVTADFFATLGVGPLLGRAFTTQDERAEARLTVISFDLWQQYFAGTDSVIGSTIQLDGYTFTIIGVMPPGFSFPRQTQVYELYRLNPSQRLMREARFLKAIGRLKQDVNNFRAGVEMTALARRLSEQYPQTNRNWGVSVVPLLEDQVGKTRPALILLLTAVAVVLLIACANVASLLLAHAVTRQGEMAVRLALGAGRSRIVRQLLTESMLLAAVGGCVGLLVGAWGVKGLLALAPEGLPRVHEARMDLPVLGFTLLASLLTGLIFDLALKEGEGRAAAHRRSRHVFGALVIAEVALAFTALVGAGLLASSFWRLQRVDPGIEVERLLTVEFEPPSSRYNGSDWKAQRLNFWNQLSARVSALPGVEAVGAVDSLPFSGRARAWRFRKAGDPPDAAAAPAASFQVATADYFRTVGMKLRSGRLFSGIDRDGTPAVAIINETMARRFWPQQDVVGQRIFIRNEEVPREIIGVVSDVRHFGLEREAEPEMYAPFEQFVIDVMPMVVRVKTAPALLVNVVREQVHAVDPGVAIARIRPLESLVSDSLAERRFTLMLVGVFGALALLLVAGGLYGVMSYSVKERTREIGIRTALGAKSSDVLQLVIGQGLRLTLIGLGAGLATTFMGTRLMSTMLFGITATDPLTLSGVTLLLIAIALLACYFPARRAIRIDPGAALRAE